MDAAICGDNMRCDYSRCGVYTKNFETLVNAFESSGFIASLEVTRRKLVLGSEDSTTGWFKKTYVNSTIDILMPSESAVSRLLSVGTYVDLTKTGFTQDVVEGGDQIETQAHVFYEVKTVIEKFVGDSFSHRVCTLKHIPLYEV